MRIAVEFEEFDRRAQQGGGFFRLGSALFRRAMRTGFAAGTNDKMRLASGGGFAGNDPAATEFDVVGMRAKNEQGRKFREIQCRLHRIGQWHRGLKN